MTEKKLSEAGLKALIDREGSKPQMYLDVAGNPTIGVGHLLTVDEMSSGKIWINGKPCYIRHGLSKDQIVSLLSQDVVGFEKLINETVTVPLTQNQFDALVSFVFNIGGQAFKRSTLLRVLNQGNYHLVPSQLQRWKYSRGKVVRGLVNRRKEEAKQWRLS